MGSFLSLLQIAVGLTFFVFLIFVFFILPVYITGANIYSLSNAKHPLGLGFEIAIYTLGPALSALLANLTRPFPYWTDTIYYNSTSVITELSHEPLSRKHFLTFAAFVLFAALGYFTLRFFWEKLSPIVIVLCMSIQFIGVIYSCFWIIQMLNHFVGQSFTSVVFAANMSLFPLNCILLVVKQTKEILANAIDILPKYKGANPLLRWITRTLFSHVTLWPVFALVLILPLVTVGIGILVLFGQEPDAIIKVFTDTSDWTLSQQIGPEPYLLDGHYLCTVAATGHKQIVKPLRKGIRHNGEIIVNRQLCIANAFEDLLKENTPYFHSLLRQFYDKFGLPISMLIRKKWIADVLYILMKPLEWFFLLVLYLWDTKPENRIALQYLPGCPPLQQNRTEKLEKEFLF